MSLITTTNHLMCLILTQEKDLPEEVLKSLCLEVNSNRKRLLTAILEKKSLLEQYLTVIESSACLPKLKDLALSFFQSHIKERNILQSQSQLIIPITRLLSLIQSSQRVDQKLDTPRSLFLERTSSIWALEK